MEVIIILFDHLKLFSSSEITKNLFEIGINVIGWHLTARATSTSKVQPENCKFQNKLASDNFFNG